MSVNNGIRKETVKGKLIAEKIYKNDFQKEGTLTCQIRQEVKTISKYPSKRTDSNLQANIFSNDDFGFADQVFESVENRIAWIPVPEKFDGKEAEIQKMLDAAFAKGACIYRALNVQPILDDNQKYAINAGLRTLDQFADSQALRYPENAETVANGTAGKLILDKNGNVQYRRTFFMDKPQEDIDVRSENVPYVSPSLKEELLKMQAENAGASVLQGQTL